ncbi:hypothetical protein Bca4012_015620 [Brassica carinata]
METEIGKLVVTTTREHQEEEKEIREKVSEWIQCSLVGSKEVEAVMEEVEEGPEGLFKRAHVQERRGPKLRGIFSRWFQMEIIPVEGLKLDEVEAGLYYMNCLPMRLVGAEGSPKGIDHHNHENGFSCLKLEAMETEIGKLVVTATREHQQEEKEISEKVSDWIQCSSVRSKGVEAVMEEVEEGPQGLFKVMIQASLSSEHHIHLKSIWEQDTSIYFSE